MGLRVILYDPDQRGNQFPLWAELATLSTFSSDVCGPTLLEGPALKALPGPTALRFSSHLSSSLQMRFPLPVSSW